MNRIKIVRIVNGEKTEVKVKLTDLVKPGDTIIVPERYLLMSDQLHFDAPTRTGPRESYDADARGAQAPPPPDAGCRRRGGRDVHLIDYVKVLYKRRWTAITAFLLVAGGVPSTRSPRRPSSKRGRGS